MLNDRKEPTASTTRDWWKGPYRLIQTNLRLPDARYEQRALAREVREFGGTALLYNIGGIFAFYPTDLPLQAVNPYMEGDALGRAVEAAHAEGLALIGRFDMSKGTRLAFDAHPEWFVRNRKGQPLEYNGTYQACVNGDWYQDYAFRIIEESLSRYDVDGVFFNMFGYTNFTYSGDYFGICVCDRCTKKFKAMYGHDLPLVEDFSDPAYADYLEFQERTARDLQARIYDHIHKVAPHVAMTGHRGKSDLIRMEVQRAVDRPQPEWPYQAGDQARWIRAYGQGKNGSSTSTNFVDFAWRFHSETGAYHTLRFAQQLASGATLDLYLLGVLDQDDISPLPQVAELFHWHARSEDHYRGLTSGARIALYYSFKTSRYRRRNGPADKAEAQFRGAYRAMVESRLPFDFVSDAIVEEKGLAALWAFDTIYLPGISCLSDTEAAALDSFVAKGGTLVVTADTGLCGPKGEERQSNALSSMPYAGLPRPNAEMRGAYFRVAKDELPLPDSRLVMLDGHYWQADSLPGTKSLMLLLPPQRFGPPELCFPDHESTLPGVVIGTHGEGRVAWLPWSPDALYFRDSLPSHRTIIADLVTRFAPPVPARIEGRGAVELTVQHQKATGRILVHVVNYSGQRNNLYEDAPDLHGLRLGVRGIAGVATLLRAGVTVQPAKVDPDAEGYLWFDLPPIGPFEALSFAAT